jgi:hypothetical protein
MVAYSGHCIGAAAAALCGLLCEQSLGSIVLWLPIEWKVVVSFLKLVEWLAQVAGGKLSSILSFLVQQLLEGFQSCDLPMLEKVQACSANLIQTRNSQDIHIQMKKRLMGGKNLRLPTGAKCAGRCKVKKKTLAWVLLQTHARPPPTHFNCAIQIETSRQCFFC